MSSENSVVCGRCIFDALKNDQEIEKELFDSFKVNCAAATDTAAFVAVRKHNKNVHGFQATKVLVAIMGADERWHLVDLEPTIQL